MVSIVIQRLLKFTGVELFRYYGILGNTSKTAVLQFGHYLGHYLGHYPKIAGHNRRIPAGYHSQ